MGADGPIHHMGDRGMAGRYQGYHIIPEAEGQVSFEVVWQNAGWFWRPPNGDAVGPFTTSSQAYQGAVGAMRQCLEASDLEHRIA